jgi:hypothetical protein
MKANRLRIAASLVRFRLRSLFAICFIAAIVSFLFARYLELRNGVANAYCAELVASLLIEYMEANDGRWPTGWDDLRTTYETSQRTWAFEELQARVEVEWKIDPAELVNLESTGNEPRFEVVWLSDGTETHGQGEGPNEQIIRYLTRRMLKNAAASN